MTESSRSTSAPPRCARSRTTRTAPPEPGDAHLAYQSLDADQLVDALPRGTRPRRPEGDALALSCFWHSLVAARRARPAADAGSHLARRDRRPARARSGRLPPAHRLLPAPLVLAGEASSAAGDPRAARYVSFADYLLLKLDRRAAHERLDGQRHRALRPEPARLGRRDARGARRRRVAARRRSRTSRSPVSFRRSATARCSNLGAGCVDADPRGGDDRHVGGAASLYAGGAADAAPGPLSLPARRAALLRGRRALRRRQPARVAPHTLRDVDTGASPTRPPRMGSTFLPFLGGERSLGWDASRRGLIDGLTFATTPRDIAQAALEGVCYRLADVLDAIGGIESVVATGGALLANATGCRSSPTSSAARSRSPPCPKARRAAPPSPRSSGSGVAVPPAPVARVRRAAPQDGTRSISAAREEQRERCVWRRRHDRDRRRRARRREAVEGYREAGGRTRSPSGRTTRTARTTGRRSRSGSCAANRSPPTRWCIRVEWYAEHGVDLRLGESLALARRRRGGHDRARDRRAPATARRRAALRTLDDSLELRGAPRRRGGDGRRRRLHRLRGDRVAHGARPPGDAVVRDPSSSRRSRRRRSPRRSTSAIASTVSTCGSARARSPPPTSSSPASASSRTSSSPATPGSRCGAASSSTSASAPPATGVYAIGDVAEFYDPVFGRHRRIEHWSNAAYHGTTLGQSSPATRTPATTSSRRSSPSSSARRSAPSATPTATTDAPRGRLREERAVLRFLRGGRAIAAAVTGSGRGRRRGAEGRDQSRRGGSCIVVTLAGKRPEEERCPTRRSNSSPSTRSGRCRWTRCSRRTPAIPAPRWRSLRSRTCSTRR